MLGWIAWVLGVIALVTRWGTGAEWLVGMFMAGDIFNTMLIKDAIKEGGRAALISVNDGGTRKDGELNLVAAGYYFQLCLIAVSIAALANQ